MTKYLVAITLLSLLVGCGLSTSTARPDSATPPKALKPTGVTATSVPPSPISPTPKLINISPCKKIAFAMFKDSQRENADIYTICPDGGGLVRLTNHPAADEAPAWSPDGVRLAFVSTRSGTRQIYVMNADGSNPVQVSFDKSNWLPKWLPVGKRIAFLTTDEKGLWWWRIARDDGSGVETLTEPSYDFFFQTPAWSPDGTKIAYMSLEEQKERNDGSSQIHVKNLDDTNDLALTNDIWANVNPLWSPDGTRIGFLSERDGTYYMFALYVMNSDGSQVRRLTEPFLGDVSTSYSWSSNGQQIVAGDFKTGSIYIIDLKTNQKTELALKEEYTAYSPSWQP